MLQVPSFVNIIEANRICHPIKMLWDLREISLFRDQAVNTGAMTPSWLTSACTLCVLVLEQSKRESHLVETGPSGCCRSAALLHCPIPEDRAHSRILSAALRTRGKVRMRRALTSVPLDSNKCEKKRKIRLRCPALMENPPVSPPPPPLITPHVIM